MGLRIASVSGFTGRPAQPPLIRARPRSTLRFVLLSAGLGPVVLIASVNLRPELVDLPIQPIPLELIAFEREPSRSFLEETAPFHGFVGTVLPHVVIVVSCNSIVKAMRKEPNIRPNIQFAAF